MAKRFFTCSLDQPYLLSPSLQDWLPEDHLARLVADLVSELNLTAILCDDERKDGRGQAAYHPVLLTRVLLYAYTTGQPSSRQIEQATYDAVPFRYLAANQHPDHDTIAAFRQRHLPALASLFVQVLRLCDKAGLVTLGHVAIDGTKIKANASTHRSVSPARLTEREQYWQDKVEGLLADAAQTDVREDAQPPVAALPPELAQAQDRLAKIRAAKQALAQEAQDKLAPAEVRRPRGRPQKGTPPPAVDALECGKRKKRYHRAKEQATQPTRSYNFTDPDSRVMFDNGPQALVHSDNAQAAVDSAAQIIVAAAITQQVIDKEQLVPMVQKVRVVLGQVTADAAGTARLPKVISADTGYWDTASLADPAMTSIAVLVPPQAASNADAAAAGEPVDQIASSNTTMERMRKKLATPEGAAAYRQRGKTVEPVFGQLKQQRGFRQFSLRGLRQVDAEWQLICTTHNLRQLCLHRRPQKAAASAPAALHLLSPSAFFFPAAPPSGHLAFDRLLLRQPPLRRHPDAVPPRSRLLHRGNFTPTGSGTGAILPILPISVQPTLGTFAQPVGDGTFLLQSMP